MTTVRTIGLGLGAFVVEVFVLAAMAGITWVGGGYLLYDFSAAAPWAIKAAAAVATLLIWAVAGAGAVALVTCAGAGPFRADRFGAIFVAGAFTGVILWWVLAVATVMNSCMWEVAFPIGLFSDNDRYRCGFR